MAERSEPCSYLDIHINIKYALALAHAHHTKFVPSARLYATPFFTFNALLHNLSRCRSHVAPQCVKFLQLNLLCVRLLVSVRASVCVCVCVVNLNLIEKHVT